LLAEGVFNSEAQTFSLTLSQSCDATADQAHKEPFVIPVSVGLLDAAGHSIAVQLKGEAQTENLQFSKTLVLSELQRSSQS
jgi:aminopeptidase N